MAIHIGIGSWGDDAYVGVLYPEGLLKTDRLRDYTRSFDHVEVNSSYYATPQLPSVRAWTKQTPDDFTFSLKLHRAFSQSPTKAAEGAFLLPKLLSATKPLLDSGRLSAFLLVMPPRFTPERHRLEELDTLVAGLAPHPLAVELRHRDWVAGKRRQSTLAFFRERQLIWVAVDMPRLKALMPVVDEVTHPRQAYLRLHGRNPDYNEAKSAAEGHAYLYPAREIASLATRVRKLADKAEAVYVIANNHARDFAPRTALALKERLTAR